MSLPFPRRTLLATSALAMIAPRTRATTAQPFRIPAAPVARTGATTDTYFGTTLADPYRWMENDRDPDWLPYLHAQNARTRAVLDAIPGRAALLARITQLSASTTATLRVQRAGTILFFQQRPTGADNSRLFARGPDNATRTLVDPTALAAHGHVSLDWWQASPDGTHVAYGLSPNGSENSVLHILEVATGRDLPEHIPDTQGASPQWTDDGTGFFYTQLTGKVDTPERFLDAQARFHRLGTDPADDPILMRRGSDHAIAYDRIQTPSIVTFEGATHALLILADIRPEFRLYLAPVAEAASGRARWHEVAGFEDEITGASLDATTLTLLANKGTPRGRILRLPVGDPSLTKATLAVPQGAEVIEAISQARDALYLRIMDGGISRLRRLTTDNRVIEIALPFDGTIDELATTPREVGALFPFTGWLAPSDIWRAGADGRVAPTGISPRPEIDTGAFEAHRGFAAARDGTRIPYSVIHRKGLVLDGTAPAWIQAYGSYGLAAYTPSFNPRTLALIEAGFIVGYANVRGGGEYGREWHKAGQLANKPNTWRDLIDVCQHLIDARYTSASRLAIGGRSAGGITVGRAMTERPDLFAAVIDGVGWSNPLRYVAEQNGYGEEPEWGAISTPDGFRALLSIDSFQHVKDGTAYPAVLLTTGVTDPRVAPFHVAKMTARLQAASSSGKPILLRVDDDAGHGIGSTRSQADREAADTYAFLLWQTGDPGYAPR